MYLMQPFLTSHVGTWEEKDMTQFSRDRLTALCLEAAVSQEFDMSVR